MNWASNGVFAVILVSQFLLTGCDGERTRRSQCIETMRCSPITPRTFQEFRWSDGTNVLDAAQVTQIVSVLEANLVPQRRATAKPATGVPPPALAPDLCVDVRTTDGKVEAQLLGFDGKLIGFGSLGMVTNSAAVRQVYDVVSSAAKRIPEADTNRWVVFDRETVGKEQLLDLRRNRNLRKISIYDSQIDDSCLDILSTFDELTYLNLTHTRPVNDDGLRKIGKLRRLMHLSLGYTGISDKGLPALTDLTNLRWLDLYGTQVSDAGLIHLARLCNLERLTLHSTAVHGPGLKYLKDLDHLRELTVSDVDRDDLASLRKNLPQLKIETIPVPRLFREGGP